MGEVVVERRERDMPRSQCRHVRLDQGRGGRRIVCGPPIRAAPGVDPALEHLAVASHAHRHHPQLGTPSQCRGGDIDVEQASGRRPPLEELPDQGGRDSGGPVVVGMVVPLKRHSDARDPEKGPLDRRRHGARIEHVDPGVEPAIDPADHEIGPTRAELGDAQLHRIGRAAINGPTAAAISLKHLLGRQRREECDRVADAALLRGGRDNLDLSKPTQRSLERSQSRGKDAVVVCQEHEHGRTIAKAA